MNGSRLVNKNVIAATGRTSMRLEPELWNALSEICLRERVNTGEMVRRIEANNHQGGRTSAVRVFIVNDNAYRVLAFRQQAQWQNHIYGTQHSNPDFCKLADSFGIPAWRITEPSQIDKVVDEIIAANPDKVAQAKAKPQALGWFVGQVMKSSGGKANPQAVNDLLKSKLGI